MTETQIVERPRRSDYVSFTEIETIEDALRNKGIMERFRLITPPVVKWERMVRVCALAVQQKADLQRCDWQSLLGAMLSLADLGLEPNTPLQHAFLIPFKARRKTRSGWEDYSQIQVVLGYKGLLELAYRGDMLLSCHADVVYGGDTFDFEYGSNQFLLHKYGEEQDEAVKRWAYAHVHLRGGGQAFEVLPYRKVMKIRDNTQSYRAALDARQAAEKDPSKDGWKMRSWETAPWVLYEHEMGQKTMLRRVCKGLRQSPEYARAADLDDRGDRVGPGAIDFARIAREPEALGEFGPALPVADVTPEPERPAPEVNTFVNVKGGVGGGPAAAPAFHLTVPPDWLALPFDDPNDFLPAYVGEAKQALGDHGGDALSEFLARNQPTLDTWAMAHPDQAIDLNRAINALRAGPAPAPPLSPTASRLDF